MIHLCKNIICVPTFHINYHIYLALYSHASIKGELLKPYASSVEELSCSPRDKFMKGTYAHLTLQVFAVLLLALIPWLVAAWYIFNPRFRGICAQGILLPDLPVWPDSAGILWTGLTPQNWVPHAILLYPAAQSLALWPWMEASRPFLSSGSLTQMSHVPKVCQPAGWS